MEIMHHSNAFFLSPPSEIIPPTFYALVVLNQPLPSFAPLLWQHARLKVFADGGANRVFDEMPLLFPNEEVLSVRQRYKPDAIKGDMDSIRPDVLEFYAGLGAKTINESHDQDTTDLNKCVSYIRDCAEELKQSDLCIIVTGALGGRFDHEAGNLNVLYRFSSLRIVLISGDCIIHLLPRTHHHEILIDPTVVGPHCGLLPVGVSCSHSTTTGVEWNLSDSEMKFGGLVSTSNLVKDNTVTVQSDSDLLWTISIKKTEKELNIFNQTQIESRNLILSINTQNTETDPPATHLTMEVMHHSTAFLLLPPSEINPSTFYALVVLNQPLPSFTPVLWQHAQMKVFADGGANRVFDEMPLLFPNEEVLSVRQRYKPDAIKGDMDSIRPDVLEFYAGLGAKIINESHDQDTTDLNKCVTYIRDCAEELKQSDLCIIVTGALGGRFDHEAGNLNVLYRFSNLRIVLISGDCIIHLLPRTHQHEIHIEPTVVGPHCGLVPLGVSCSRSTTTGLEWNLSDTEMKFGGLVSTSNLVKDNKVTVQSDSDLLWTISIKKTEKE